ncbi:MAG: class I SAM-dependent methyltransferase [Alphaproteobacteria bacterium]|nr:class I SAM-dependent methyltransferase [Alphaproteobacteria bacterium]
MAAADTLACRRSEAFASLCELGRALQRLGYSFVTPTPLTIERVNRRPENAIAGSLRGFFGWSRPISPERLPPAIMELARSAGILEPRGSLVASKLRFSTLSGMLFAHSAFPTVNPDAVFFGPDTYRFGAMIERVMAELTSPPRRILDLGCGSGVGGILAAQIAANRPLVVLTDINPGALHLARANAQLADTPAAMLAADVCSAFAESKFDLIVSNPPYLRDPANRLYRNGGGTFGEGLSLRILREGLACLAQGGRLALYTGSAIVAGHDLFREQAETVLAQAGRGYEYKEIDPDVFGEELDGACYREVERIAVVSLVVCG